MSVYITKEKILPVIQEVVVTKGDITKTIECQVTLKNYDFKKDVRFDTNCKLPFPKRSSERITVIADANLAEQCKALGYDYILVDDVIGTKKEHKQKKKKICNKTHAFIGLPTFNKAFEMRILAAKNKPIYVIKNASELQNMYEDVKRTVRFRLRKSVNMHFCCGHSKMEADDLAENVNVALQHLIGVLKKGMQNLQSVYIKTTQGKPIKVFGK